MKKNILIIFNALLLITAVCADETPSRFTVQLGSSRINWNPHYAYTTTEAQVFMALYEGLVSYHPANLRPIPGAAESWEISEDKQSITFRLRDRLMWSNGNRLTAEDFRDSLLHLLHPDTQAEYASLLDDVVGAREFRTGAGLAEDVGIQAPDMKTLIFRLTQPTPQFLATLCHYSFVPVHRDFRKLQDWSALKSIPVNGPFIIQSRNPEEVILIRNPNYWDTESVSLDTLRLLFLDDPTAVMERFNRFDIDWVAAGMDTSQLALPETLNISPLFSTTYYYFSNAVPAWANADVRRALALLLPWDEIRSDRLIPATSLVPPIPNYPQADAAFPSESQREEEAMQLLDGAGFPRGEGLPPMKIRVPVEDPVARLMEETWKETLALDVAVEIIEFPHYYNSVKEGGYGIATLTWTGDYADPQSFLGMWNTDSSFNESGFADENFDNILEEAALMAPSQRLVKLQEAEEILLRTCQVLPVEHFPAVNIIDRRFVEGWFPNALDIHPFKSLVLQRGFSIPGVVMRRGQGEPRRFTRTRAMSLTP